MGSFLKKYSFNKYKTIFKKNENIKEKTNLLISTKNNNFFSKIKNDIDNIVNGVFLTRDLVSEPPNYLNPQMFVNEIKKLSKLGLKVEVFDHSKMKKIGMNALLGVAQGSKNLPYFVTIKWKPTNFKNKKPLSFIGKGVCFDTGGISLKPAKFMEDMKYDMAGAGAVVGLMKTLALRKSKSYVIGTVALVENMPGGSAQRPGDIVKSYSGKTIEVLNTDAEGRLIHQTLDSQLLSKDEINVVDLGCGHAYLTFAVQEFLKDKHSKVSILGVDERQDSKEHNEKVAAKLKIEAKFIAAKIADTPDQKVDVAIALHACDTATDDAIYWAVRNDAKVIMAAPCCMHDLQTQIKDSPEPWELLTKYGLVKERLVDLITDSLRAQILKLLGFRVDIVEFIGGEHTARNILIRAVRTGAAPSDLDKQRFQQMLNDWQIKPYLAQLLADELKAAAQISRP